jgi:hypothetical protein
MEVDPNTRYVLNIAIMTIRKDFINICFDEIPEIKTKIYELYDFVNSEGIRLKTEYDSDIVKLSNKFFGKDQKISLRKAPYESVNKSLTFIFKIVTNLKNAFDTREFYTYFPKCFEFTDIISLDTVKTDIKCVIDKINTIFSESSTRIKELINKDVNIQPISVPEYIEKKWNTYSVPRISYYTSKSNDKYKIDLYAAILALRITKGSDLTNFIQLELTNDANTDFINYIFTDFFEMVKECKKSYDTDKVITFYNIYSGYLSLIKSLPSSPKQTILYNFLNLHFYTDMYDLVNTYFTNNLESEDEFLTQAGKPAGGKKRKTYIKRKTYKNKKKRTIRRRRRL